MSEHSMEAMDEAMRATFQAMTPPATDDLPKRPRAKYWDIDENGEAQIVALDCAAFVSIEDHQDLRIYADELEARLAEAEKHIVE